MAALATGVKAPEFELKTLDGRKFSLSEELAKGPVMLVFFKVSCPTCQYALPYLERLYKAYKNKGVTLVGVSQNDANGIRIMRDEVRSDDLDSVRLGIIKQVYGYRV